MKYIFLSAVVLLLPSAAHANPIPLFPYPYFDPPRFISLWILCIVSETATALMFLMVLKMDLKVMKADLKIVRSVVAANLISYPPAWAAIMLAEMALTGYSAPKFSEIWPYYGVITAATVAVEIVIAAFEAWFIRKRNETSISALKAVSLSLVNNGVSFTCGIILTYSVLPLWNGPLSPR